MQQNTTNVESARSRTELILFFMLIAVAAVSVAGAVIILVSPDYLPDLTQKFVPDRAIAPASRAFLKNLFEESALLAAFLSIFALIANYLPRHTRPAAFAALIGGAGLLHWIYYLPLTIDDAYISLVYAKNLAMGRGLMFNLGDRVEGYTNLLWVLIETLLFKTRLNAVMGAKIIGFLCGLGVLFLTFLLSRLRESEHGYFPFLAPLLLAISSPFATASALGLETQLFTLLILAATYLYLKADDMTPGYSVSLLLAMATLTRPEGVLFFGGIYGHSFILRLSKKRFDWKLILSALPYAAIMAAHVGWRYLYYGALLPNTYYAKLEGSPWRMTWGYQYVKRFFITYGGSIFGLCLIPFVKRENLRRNSLLLFLTAGFLFYVIYTGGDWIPRFRFIEPVVPFIFLLFADGLNDLFVFLRGHIRASTLSKAVVLILLGFIIHFPIADTVSLHKFAMLRARGAKVSHIFLGKWLKTNMNEDESVALMDIGMVKYFSGREVIDISGLTDAHVAHLPGGFLKKEFDLNYLLDRNPKYVVLVSHNDIRKGGFRSSYPIDESIYGSPQFHQRYEFLFNLNHLYLRENPVPDAGYYMNVFVRRELSASRPAADHG